MTFQRAAALQLLKAHANGFLKASFEVKTRAPAKKFAAIMHIDYLLKLREAYDH